MYFDPTIASEDATGVLPPVSAMLIEADTFELIVLLKVDSIVKEPPTVMSAVSCGLSFAVETIVGKSKMLLFVTVNV